MTNTDMARPSEQALVNEAPPGLHPTGFDPSRGQYVTCASCGGAGIVSVWSFGVKEPDECSGCYGSGQNWRYSNGMVAKHYGGPFVGRDTDGSPEGRDAQRLDGEAATAGAGTASPETPADLSSRDTNNVG